MNIEIEDIAGLLTSSLEELVAPDRIPQKRYDTHDIKIEDSNGENYYNCSYIGALYENVDLQLAIDDFALVVSDVLNKYTALGYLLPASKLKLASSPQCGNRFLLIYYVFLKELPRGACAHKIENSFDADIGQLDLQVRLAGPARKNVKVFGIGHSALISGKNVPEDDFEKVKYFFRDLPDDLKYAETLPRIGPNIRIVCQSSSFPENEVLEEWFETAAG